MFGAPGGSGFGTSLRRRLLCPLVALDGVAGRTVKELVEQAKQFEFAVNFERTAQKSLLFKELPQALLGQEDGPGKVGKRNALAGAALADGAVAALDLGAGLMQQPLT